MARVGTALVVLGLLAIGYGVLWQLGLAPGSRVTLPEPVALQRAGARDVSATSVPEPTLAGPGPTKVPTGGPRPTATTVPTATPVASGTTSASGTTLGRVDHTPVGVRLSAADAADRVETAHPPASHAVRLVIPAIKVDTEVKQAGIVEDARGQPVWETLPFVAVHYGDLTSLIGAPGNAVIAGHVVTLSEGNVFRFLYQLAIGDQIDVWDELTREHDFRVVAVKLVPPSDTSVMDPTPDETLTLITCGGTFDPQKREFSDRLIVTAKPL